MAVSVVIGKAEAKQDVEGGCDASGLVAYFRV